MVTPKVYTTISRSAWGNNQYQKLALGSSLGAVPFPEFLNTFYKKYVMESAKNCTNLPQFKNKFSSLKSGTYWAKSCLFNSADIPIYFQDGHYKFEFLIVTDDNHGIGCRIIAKISKVIL